MSQHWMWDGAEWKQRAALPKPSMSKFAAHGVLGGKLFVFSQLDGLHHAYDPATDTWSDSPAPMPAALAMPAVVGERDRLHVLGGLNPAKPGAPSRGVLTYDAAANQWHGAE